MRDETVAGFLNNLGARQPVPGGGAVSALNGAVASAQLKMVCEYTRDREINGQTKFLVGKQEAFLGLAEADSKAFTNVSEAYKSDDPKQINSALMGAMTPSFNIVDSCEEIIDFCELNLEKFNPKLKADLIVVLANLKASLRSAKAMIKTNTESLKENRSDQATIYIKKSDELLGKIDSFYERLGA